MNVTASKLDTSKMTRALSDVIRKALPLAERQDILAKALQPVAELMRANAPKDSGQSAKAITVQIIDGSTPDTAAAEVGVGQKGFPLRFSEYGTEHQAAHPVIRPAWEGSASEVKRQIATSIEAAIKAAR